MTADANFIRYALGKTADDAAARGMPRLELKGQLIRPMLAYEAAMYNDTRLSPQFWSGGLALSTILRIPILSGLASHREHCGK